VVRKVLTDAARSGLPGEHHFNISFKTSAPGVTIPVAMRQRYPDEMAIILQHEFWDLSVNADGFEVSLNFSRRPERLTIPFDSITGFSDPSVPFGFKLEPRVAPEGAKEAPPSVERPSLPRPNEEKPPSKAARAVSAPAKPPELSAPKAVPKPKDKEKAPAGEPAKVVSIDAFRKK
jgi:hypothetical protein